MESSQHTCSSIDSNNSTWTAKQNKLFEDALAIYDENTPDRWNIIAKIVGGTSAEQVKRQYEILVDDIESIESDKVPIPDYVTNESNSEENSNSNEEQRLKHLKL